MIDERKPAKAAEARMEDLILRMRLGVLMGEWVLGSKATGCLLFIAACGTWKDYCLFPPESRCSIKAARGKDEQEIAGVTQRNEKPRSAQTGK